MVHGGRDAVDAILDHPQIQGVSFVGSSPIALHLQAGAENGKRVQALGGAKNFTLIMPDADMDRAASEMSTVASAAPVSAASRNVVLGVGTRVRHHGRGSWPGQSGRGSATA